jgi:glycosyltransferase involved in cell wall biosynthesis
MESSILESSSHLVSSTYRYAFTVFTTTYNRAYTLPQVYESLKAQTYRNFEWLVINNGSSDNTDDLVNQWKQEAEFPIRYIVLEKNIGFPRANNLGVREAEGEFFLNLNSDDACVPEALERFRYHWDTIPEEEKKNFAGITALAKNQYGHLIGQKFPADVFDSTNAEIQMRHQVFGEKWGFNRTDVLRKFPYPEIEDEKFICSRLIWNRISVVYKTRFINEVLEIFRESGSDTLSSISHNVSISCPKGMRLVHYEAAQLPVPLFWKVRNMLHYNRASFHDKISLSQIIVESGNWSFAVLLLFPSFGLYLFDLYRLRSLND